MITALFVGVKEKPERVEVDATPNILDQLVGGTHTELLVNDAIDAVLICDGSAAVDQKPFNREIKDEYGFVESRIAGDFLVVGRDKEGQYQSLTPEQFEKYEQMFRFPQILVKMEDDYQAVTVDSPNIKLQPEQNYPVKSTQEDRGQSKAFQVETKGGTLLAEANPDPELPGITISFRPKDADVYVDLMDVESKGDKDIHMYAYENLHSGDCIFHSVVSGQEASQLLGRRESPKEKSSVLDQLHGTKPQPGQPKQAKQEDMSL